MLSSVTIEIAELRSGVSKLHARVANYHDLAGKKVKFKAVTNGIDMPTWTARNILAYFERQGIIDKFYLPTEDYKTAIDTIKAEDIKTLKASGRRELNTVLARRPDQYGNFLNIPEDALLFEFKRRFVDYKRPWLPFTHPEAMKDILERNNAHYIFAGRVHEGDNRMMERLTTLLADYPKPAYMRVGRGAVPEIYGEGLEFEIGRAIVAREGADLTIAATGEAVAHAIEAAGNLAAEGINATVLDYSCIVPFDSATLRKYALASGKVLTVEELSRWGGLGAIIAEELGEEPVAVRVLGVPDENAPHGTSAQIAHYFGLDAEGIAASAKDFLKK